MVAGESYDQLVIGGTAMLGGTLEVQLVEDATRQLFRPEDGTAFQFVTAAGGLRGTFDQVVFNTPGVTADLDVTYDNGNVMVTVMDTTLLGDFNGDDVWSVEDLDLLSGAPRADICVYFFCDSGDRKNVNDKASWIDSCAGGRRSPLAWWSVVGGRWSVVGGRWSVVGGRHRRYGISPAEETQHPRHLGR